MSLIQVSEVNSEPSQTNKIGILSKIVNGLKWLQLDSAKLAKWLSCVLSTNLYGAFDCMFLSCYVRVSVWIHTL